MNVLDKVNNVDDLKNLKIDELAPLCRDIREFLIRSISKTGGHLASNLGVVELTVALHYVLNSPTDKIVWDVGHQSYTHKILTGRKNQFGSLRQYKGLSGFPKTSESEHDSFDVGHSTTSISVALGYAVARDIKKENNKVYAVIGDGSMTGGMAYEALNHAGRANSNIVVILNDNNMSISENVGALSQSLNHVRISKGYNEAKKSTHNVINKLPAGNHIEKFISSTKDIVRDMVVDGSFFEELGFKYYRVKDGHDVKELVKVIESLNYVEGPILLHVSTKKGKGYKKAEKNPTHYHGVKKFDVRTGTSKSSDSKTYSDVFGDIVTEYAINRDDTIVITPAMIAGSGLSKYAEQFSDKIIDVGIAEEHAVTFAGGLAKNGIKPIVSIYSSFLQRAYDQVIHDVCLQSLPVIFAIDRAGIVGEDGETHQGVFDISFLGNIPNMTIMSPTNEKEMREMFDVAIEKGTPTAIRYSKGCADDRVGTTVEYGKCEIVQKGNKAVVVAVGNMLINVLEANEMLKEKNIEVTIINPRFIAPVDKDMVSELLKYEHIFVVEDGLIKNGFGQQLLGEMNNCNVNDKLPKFHMLGYENEFIEQGSVDELHKQYGLDGASIYERIIKVL